MAGARNAERDQEARAVKRDCQDRSATSVSCYKRAICSRNSSSASWPYVRKQFLWKGDRARGT